MFKYRVNCRSGPHSEISRARFCRITWWNSLVFRIDDYGYDREASRVRAPYIRRRGERARVRRARDDRVRTTFGGIYSRPSVISGRGGLPPSVFRLCRSICILARYRPIIRTGRPVRASRFRLIVVCFFFAFRAGRERASSPRRFSNRVLPLWFQCRCASADYDGR